MTRTSKDRLRRLKACAAGAAALEFAFALPVLAMAAVGIMEFGRITFAESLLEGGLREAARFGITGAEPETRSRKQEIAQIITDNAAGLFTVTEFDVDANVYPNFVQIGQPEPYTDTNGNGQYDASVPEPYTDINCNTQWDDDMGRAGLGAGGEVVLYRVTIELPLLTGMLAPIIGQNGKFPLDATVAVRNEPFNAGDPGCNP